jgi:hypothetical protein
MPPVATTKISLQDPRIAPPADSDLFPIETPAGATGAISWALLKLGVSAPVDLERERYINQTLPPQTGKSYQTVKDAIEALASGEYTLSLAPGTHPVTATAALPSGVSSLAIRGAGGLVTAPGMSAGTALTGISRLSLTSGAVTPVDVITGGGGTRVTLQDLEIIGTGGGGATITLFKGTNAYKRIAMQRCELGWSPGFQLCESQAAAQVGSVSNEPFIFEDVDFTDYTLGSAPLEVPLGTCSVAPNLTLFQRCTFREMSWTFPAAFYFGTKTIVFDRCHIDLSATAAFLAFGAMPVGGPTVIFRNCLFTGTGCDIATAGTANQTIHWEGDNFGTEGNNIPYIIPQVGIPIGSDVYTPREAAEWAAPAPTTQTQALDRIAYALQGLLGGPIPDTPAELITEGGDQIITGDGDQIIAP